MRGVNRVILVGNLGKDPEIKELTGGVIVASLALATTDMYRLKTGEVHSDTQWHTVIFWRALAGLAQRYLRKGSLVLIEGRIRYRVYQDKEGNSRSKAEILGDRLLMLDKPMSKKAEGIIDLLGDDSPPF